MKLFTMGLIAVLCVLALAGCVTPPRGDYVPSNEPGISSTAPRPHDVRLAVTEIVDSMFNEWNFASQASGKKPYIAFTGMENETPYRWNINEIIGWIEESVVRTGKATFSNATDPNRRGGRSGQLYRQIDFQDPDNEYVDQSTAVKKGGIQGADYELFGRIYTYEELRTGRFTEANYVIELRLSDLRTGGTAWMKMVPIRKNVPR
jgi:PBP1b-binding outer membrane lipoprotein LpoB